MTNPFITLAGGCKELHGLADVSRDVIVLSTRFDPKAKRIAVPPAAAKLSADSEQLLAECARRLNFNGVLFVYGLPRELALWSERLAGMRGEGWQMVFKYWFALDIDDAPRGETLKPTHLGLLMFAKAAAGKRGLQLKLHLNVDAVRTPHLHCAACGNTLKDWGGKKHLMNPKGAAVSDVWRDLPRRTIRDSVIPDDVLARVAALVPGENRLHVIQTGAPVSDPARFCKSSLRAGPETGAPATAIAPDTIHHGDCVSFLNGVAEQHPNGLFDLAFADPPYNLAKSYDTYTDELAEHKYIEWCNAWLEGMARSLKPGGSLFVLNLPKWAIHHATFLNRHLEFRHWLVWDALSDPRGKIMPAHYALLWYTKPGAKPVCNCASAKAPLPTNRSSGTGVPPVRTETHGRDARATTAALPSCVLPPDSPKYCLRAACIRDRKARGDNETVELSDVWFDVHRIKHKRDRDAHPCQLPEKLMERIIKLTTNQGDWVFDPFCGTGTTAIAATKLGRKFVVTELDENYVRITREKLAAMKHHTDLFGEIAVPRESKARLRGAASKREVELYLQNLARKLGRVPTEREVESDQPEMLRKIDAVYAYRSAAFKRAKVALAG